MRALIAGALIVVAGSASAAQAQSEPVAVPGRPPVVADPLRKIQIVAFAAEPYAWAPPPPEMIRRTRPDTDPATWLRETDAPIAAWLANPALTNVTLVLQVGTEGTVTKCTSQEVKGVQPPAWAGDLCPLVVSRAKLVPALKDDGSRITDRFILNTNFAFSAYTRNMPGPLISSHGLSPAPPPNSEFDPQLQAWPPSPRWLSSFSGRPVFKGPAEWPGEAALAAPLIGLVAADRKNGSPECRVVQSSGDAALDERACTHVRKTLKPAWPNMVPIAMRRWPLLLSPVGKGFRAVQPNANLAGWARLEQGEVQRLGQLWRSAAGPVGRVVVTGILGADGRPGNCRVYDSSGNDAADALACHLFRTEARIVPARDVFGQPMPRQSSVRMEL
jgi:hypothetical protein